MNTKNSWLIAKYFFKQKLKSKGILLLLGVFSATQIFVSVNGWNAYENQHHIREHHQEKQRKSWEDNPDKHPHRMAHFGSFAFRLQHPLSVFDSGLENYTGNAIFLEAHQQNTANFSEASFSTGLMRFGDLNLAMLLYTILPLIIFFIGYDVISREKENETLKLMILQGAEMKEIVLGKTLGLYCLVFLFLIPSFVALGSLLLLEDSGVKQEVFVRGSFLIIMYLVFFAVLSFFTVLVSAKSRSSNQSLLFLLGFWLLFFVVIPRTAQVFGAYLHPNPTRLIFKKNIAEEVKKIGDSHNPNDPYFNSIKDSVLLANNVKNVSELPFNYDGFIMAKGEEITSKLYTKHQQKLINIYGKQNRLANLLEIVNPYLAIKNISMSFSGTDFQTYHSFLLEAEKFRYNQSQLMNKLQMKYISSKAKGSEGKVNVISKEYWKNAPDFHYTYTKVSEIISKQLWSIISLFLWLFLLILGSFRFSNKIKVL